MGNTRTLRSLARAYVACLGDRGVVLAGKPNHTWGDALAVYDDGNVLPDLINMWDRSETRYEFDTDAAAEEPNLEAALASAPKLQASRWKGALNGNADIRNKTVAEMAVALRCSPLRLVRAIKPLALNVSYDQGAVTLEWQGCGSVREKDKPVTPLGLARRLLDVPATLVCLGAEIGGGRPVLSRLESGQIYLSPARQTRLEMFFELEPGTLGGMEKTRQACAAKLKQQDGRTRVRLPQAVGFQVSLTPFGLQFEPGAGAAHLTERLQSLPSEQPRTAGAKHGRRANYTRGTVRTS